MANYNDNAWGIILAGPPRPRCAGWAPSGSVTPTASAVPPWQRMVWHVQRDALGDFGPRVLSYFINDINNLGSSGHSSLRVVQPRGAQLETGPL